MPEPEMITKPVPALDHAEFIALAAAADTMLDAAEDAGMPADDIEVKALRGARNKLHQVLGQESR